MIPLNYQKFKFVHAVISYLFTFSCDIIDGHFVIDCAMVDCEECIENKDMVVGECTKCIGAHVLDQGTCNDSKSSANSQVFNI